MDLTAQRDKNRERNQKLPRGREPYPMADARAIISQQQRQQSRDSRKNSGLPKVIRKR